MENANLVTIFMTGLLAGGLTCLAVQGGLLAATIAQRSHVVKDSNDKEEKFKSEFLSGNLFPLLSFLIAKLIAYTILGIFLGWFGSLFQLSLTARIVMQVAVAIFMIGTALNILNVHPIFRYFIIQPPKFITRKIRKQSKNGQLFTPLLLGAFTVFIPCGTTQAIMALAIASGNPVSGGLIMFAFILGTLPLFFLLGFFATKLNQSFQQRFMKIAAFAVIILAIYNLNAAFALTGFDVNSKSNNLKVLSSENIKVEELTIYINSRGYSSNSLEVHGGSKVKLHVVNKDGYGCQQAFTIPKFGFEKIIAPGESETIEFTAPQASGQVAFMCSMGMYRGAIKII